MFANVKTNYMFSSTGTPKTDSEKARRAIEAVREAVQISKMHGTPNIRIPVTSEVEVAQAVTTYFSESQFAGFSVDSEYEIQMGSAKYRTDIALRDAEEKLVTIAECKLEGDSNYDHEPLKSFLCATDVPFGIFATDIDRDSWYFYENLHHNRFRLIDRSDFETRILESLEEPTVGELAM